ncbi:MAG: hypothetical protein Rubg2KO_24680 [Rubricoccaceae bacterium]
MLSLLFGLVVGIVPVTGVPVAPPVEPDTVQPRHVTLEGWDRRVRLAAWDRSRAVGGLYYDRGVLRRWTRDMDHEYDLDNFSIKPTLSDDAAFYASENGFRTAAGSITTGSFVIESEVKTGAHLIGPLDLEVRFVQQEDLSATRAGVELGYLADLGKGHRVGLRHSVASLKMDIDAELVYQFTHPKLEADLSFGRLDIANNIINEVLVPSAYHFDTLRVYQTIPYWLASRVSMPVGPVRFEAVGGISPESRADVRSQTMEQARFRYDNTFAYWGGLVESEVLTNHLVIGAMASQSQSDATRRTPPDVIARSSYTTRQTQLRGGVFALATWRAFRAEAWWMHERVADRQWGSSFAGSTIDKEYGIEERWDWTRLRLDWRPGSRWGPLVGIEYAAGLREFPVEGDQEELQREVVRQFPYGPNRRMTARLGFRFSPRADITIGASRDLDNDPFFPDQNRRYDGTHLRIRALW